MVILRVVGILWLGGLATLAWADASRSQLADAAMNDDKDGVRALLQQKTDPNAAQPDGSTPLLWAVRADDPEMVNALIQAGAAVNTANSAGATPLYQASVNGNAAIIGVLLQAGADVNGTFLTTGETALMEAARSGNVEAVKVLIDHGAKIDARDHLRETTPLMWAASEDHPEVIRLLVARGADINAQSKTEKGRPYGTSGPDSQKTSIYGELLRGGITPLVLTARDGAIASVRTLIETGADINKPSGDGSTALLVAVQNGHYDVARFLVDQGANVNRRNQKEWSPLYLAIKHRTIETGELPSPPNANLALDFIKLLLDRGAEVNVQLAYETETHSSSHVVWLKEAGATPFFRAAYGGDIEVMKMLLAHGADPSVATFDNTTPLMALVGVGYTLGVTNHLSEKEDLAALNLLLDLKADVNAVNGQGLTPVMGAAHRGVNDEIRILVDHGAKLDAHDKGEYCSYGRRDAKDCPGGVIALNYAKGLPVTGEAPIRKPETVTFIEKMMTDRGIRIPRDSLADDGGGTSGK